MLQLLNSPLGEHAHTYHDKLAVSLYVISIREQSSQFLSSLSRADN